MAWINLVSERPTQRALLKRDELDGVYESVSLLAPVLRAAVLSDQPDRAKANIERAESYLAASASALRTSRMKYTSWIHYAEVVTCAVLSHYVDCDDAKLIEQLLAAKPSKDPNFAALHHLISIGFGKAKFGKGLSHRGHDDEDFAKWPRMVKAATATELINLALCPDHPRWRVLQHFAVPAVFAALGPDADRKTALDALAWAGRKDTGKGLLYTRNAAPPGPDPEAAGKDVKWAQGIDAVEKNAEGGFQCHYNMSMRHWAPWFCDEDLDAFWFLNWFEADWQAAVSASPALRAAELAQLNVMIHYDPANSSIVPAGLERAEKKYGRRISMADFSADEANWP